MKPKQTPEQIGAELARNTIARGDISGMFAAAAKDNETHGSDIRHLEWLVTHAQTKLANANDDFAMTSEMIRVLKAHIHEVNKRKRVA